MSQPRLTDALLRLETDLRKTGVPWALVGGLAVSARVEPRTTRDVDVVVAVDDEAEAEEIVRDLLFAGYRHQALLQRRVDGSLSTMRLFMPSPNQSIAADLLFNSSGIEPEITSQAELLEVLPGLMAPVARTGHLLALKVLASRPDRPQDAGDIGDLLKVASDEELHRAREALDLIERRGFHRHKDLQADLEDFRARFSTGRG